MAQLPHP